MLLMFRQYNITKYYKWKNTSTLSKTQFSILFKFSYLYNFKRK